MRRYLLNITFGLMLMASARADDKPKADAAKTPAEQLEAIKKEYSEANAKYIKAIAKLDGWKRAEDFKKGREAYDAYDAFRTKRNKGFAQALKIVQSAPKSPTGFAALKWLLTVRTISGNMREIAVDLVTRYYAADPRIVPIIRRLAEVTSSKYSPAYPATVELFKAVVKKNTEHAARSWAAIGLAGIAYRRFAAAEHKNSPVTQELAAEAEKQLQTVTEDYSGIDRIDRRAKAKLFELRHLRVGQVAPDIVGKDLNGVKFKLSDYRGKVVVLDFWSHTYGATSRMAYPQMRSLVMKFKDQPFALIGVNQDEDKKIVQDLMKKKTITWRSFWDVSPRWLAISSVWNAYGWPTVYVLDGKGIIRFRYIDYDDGKEILDGGLEKVVEKLLKETKSSKIGNKRE